MLTALSVVGAAWAVGTIAGAIGGVLSNISEQLSRNGNNWDCLDISQAARNGLDQGLRWGIGSAAVAFSVVATMGAGTLFAGNAVAAGAFAGATSNAGIGVAISAFSNQHIDISAVLADAIIGGVFGGVFARLLGPSRSVVSAIARSGYRLSLKPNAHLVRLAARGVIGGLVNTTQGIASRVVDQFIANEPIDWSQVGNPEALAKDFLYGAAFMSTFDVIAKARVGNYQPHPSSPRHNMASTHRETMAKAFDHATSSLTGALSGTNVSPFFIEFLPAQFLERSE